VLCFQRFPSDFLLCCQGEWQEISDSSRASQRTSLREVMKGVNLSRFAGVSEAPAERESAGEMPSASEGSLLEPFCGRERSASGAGVRRRNAERQRGISSLLLDRRRPRLRERMFRFSATGRVPHPLRPATLLLLTHLLPGRKGWDYSSLQIPQQPFQAVTHAFVAGPQRVGLLKPLNPATTFPAPCSSAGGAT
jgi:hypothetical protein